MTADHISILHCKASGRFKRHFDDEALAGLSAGLVETGSDLAADAERYDALVGGQVVTDALSDDL